MERKIDLLSGNTQPMLCPHSDKEAEERNVFNGDTSTSDYTGTRKLQNLNRYAWYLQVTFEKNCHA